jgi:hypothetical protein
MNDNKPSQEDIETIARLIASQLHEQNRRAEGVPIKGTRAAGVAFVIADRETSTVELTWGSESEDQISHRVATQIANGGLPIGFVQWQSTRVETGSEIRTESQLFLGTEHMGPWAQQMLELAMDTVRSQWSPQQ